MSREFHEQNRRSWNAATRAHNSHKADQAAFLRAGGTTLFSEELELLGELPGRRLLHLQCNSGQDSLCLARLGAEVTGVDISDEAIDFATGLSRASGIPANFERADVYDWLERARANGERFDLVFASYGAMPWLSSVERWAAGAAGMLGPGGRLVLVEFHPVMTMFDEQWQFRYPYSSGGREAIVDSGVGDYVATSGLGLTPSGRVPGVRGFSNEHACVEFYWGTGDVVDAVACAGLVVERFREYPHANGCRFGEGMRELPERRFLPPERLPAMPLMYGLSARQP